MRPAGVSKTGLATAMPVPSITPSPVPSVNHPWQKKKDYREVWHYSFKPSGKLLDYLSDQDPSFAKRNGYAFSASEVEMYEVLSVVNPDDALPLLDAGVRTKKDAKEVLKAAGLSKLIDDYSDMTDEALKRGIIATDYLQVFSRKWEVFRDDPDRFLDLAQETSDLPLKHKFKDLNGNVSTFQEMIDDGSIEIAHVREIGAARLRGAVDNHGFLVEGLKRMKDGSSLYMTEHLDKWIDRFDLVDKDSKSYNKAAVLSLALRHDPEYVSALPNDMFSVVGIYTYSDTALRLGYGPEDERDFITFGTTASSEIIKATGELGSGYGDADFGRLFKAGITPEQIGMGVRDKLTPEQLIAIKHHGVTPSIANGWL